MRTSPRAHALFDTLLPALVLNVALTLPVHAVCRALIPALSRRAPARSSSVCKGGTNERMTAPPSTPYTRPRAPSSRFLPPDPNVHEPYRLTPGLALRVGIVGAVALAAFAVLFFRLWSLQVLSGERYLTRRRTTSCARSASRRRAGYIVDRNGKVIVVERARHRREAVGRRPARSRAATT